MKKGNRITDSEWEIMEVVWSNGPQKASEIIKIIKSNIAWNDKTVRTLIDRLVHKNLLGVKKDSINVYYPLVEKEQCIKEATDTFINKMFKGSASLFLSNFIKNQSLSQEDIEALKTLLQSKEDGI